MISDGKPYVFGSPAPGGPALFQKDLAGNIREANANRRCCRRFRLQGCTRFPVASA
jgi:hypothetical protein